MFSGKGDNETDEKSTEEIDEQCDKGKLVGMNGKQPQKIAANGAESAAAANGNAVPQHKAGFLSVENKKGRYFNDEEVISENTV